MRNCYTECLEKKYHVWEILLSYENLIILQELKVMLPGQRKSINRVDYAIVRWPRSAIVISVFCCVISVFSAIFQYFLRDFNICCVISIFSCVISIFSCAISKFAAWFQYLAARFESLLRDFKVFFVFFLLKLLSSML